jgi:drug/metabolite transporter (DMT)-like permease
MPQWPGKRLVLGDPPPRAEGKPALGVSLAVLTAMVSAIGFIAAKPVLGYRDPLSFSVSQFALATGFSLLWLVARRRARTLARVTAGQWTFLVVTALLFLAAVYTMWIGLSRIPATAASLLNRLEILVTVLLGMAFLGDRFTRREIAGATVMFLGVVLLRYEAPPSFTAGFYMMVLSSMLFGLIEVLNKTRIHAIPPDTFAFCRNALAFAFFLVAATWRVAMKEDWTLPGLVDWDGISRGWPLIAATALVGPFLARTLYLHGIRHLDVSRAALINQSQPLFVAVYSAILLHTLPSRREWTGGLLILAGALLLVRWRRGFSLLRPRRLRRRWRRRPRGGAAERARP